MAKKLVDAGADIVWVIRPIGFNPIKQSMVNMCLMALEIIFLTNIGLKTPLKGSFKHLFFINKKKRN